jgi:hypothetical protein
MSSPTKARSVRPESVFINCPFDSEFRPLLRAACFAILACGHKPCCALDYNDSGTVRLVEILRMIAESAFSIHDISRVQLDKASKLPRFNMPLELGADLGLRLLGPPRHRQRKILILDAVTHRYDKTISDISGLDIVVHANSEREMIRHVRDWLNDNWRLDPNERPAGATAIYYDYQAYLKIAPDIVTGLRLDPHDQLPHTDYLRVVEIALPLIAAARRGKF